MTEEALPNSETHNKRLKYRDTRPTEVPDQKAMSLTGRFSRSFTRVKNNWFSGSCFGFFTLTPVSKLMDSRTQEFIESEHDFVWCKKSDESNLS